MGSVIAIIDLNEMHLKVLSRTFLHTFLSRRSLLPIDIPFPNGRVIGIR